VLRRLAGAAFIAFLVLAIAVTPLSATFRPGYFELRVPPPSQFLGPVGVLLQDDTGLVMGFDTTEWRYSAPPSEPTRRLVVNVEGDSDDAGILMEFAAIDGGYRFTATRTKFFSYPIGVGRGYSFVLVLRAPIDPGAITYAGNGFNNGE
jgi:hypothetical protein